MDLAAVGLMILHQVGGRKNIESLVYCATRLRFVLKDETLVEDDQVRNIPGVKNTFNTRGQYQVVVGAENIEELYQKLIGYLSTDVEELMPEHSWATSILLGIGGQENLLSVAYCATRLRFELSNYMQVDDKQILQLAPVKNTFFTRGQYQIVIGDEQVKQIYQALTSLVSQQICGEKRAYGRLQSIAKNRFGTE